MFTLNAFQKSLAVSLLVLLFTGCNQQEFYEKEFLEGVGVPDDNITIADDNDGDIDLPPDTPIIVDTDPGSTSGGTTDPGSTSGGTTDPGTTSGGTTDPGTTSGGTTDPGTTSGGTTDPGTTSGGTTDPQPGVCGDGTLQNAEDTFTQNTAQNAKVDILWVVDDSGSMGDEQSALAYNFDVFINDFIQKDIDFQMAITTTDGRDNYSGLMRGDANKLTRQAARDNEAQFKNDFKDMIRVGTRGSGREMGLETSKDFFDRYRDWMRDDAYLVVVYISDEQDQSADSVASYVDRLKALKAQGGLVKAYSIVTQNIDPSKQWETLGTRYEEASQITGGEIANIHEDFYTTLSNFGFKILELLDSFPLSGVPVDTNIAITVNGSSLQDGWTYDEQARVIKFDRNAIPSEGSIVIAYYQKCVGQ